MTTTPDPLTAFPPGSPVAVDRGCTCPITDNHAGLGCVQEPGKVFVTAQTCPLHGTKPFNPLECDEDKTISAILRVLHSTLTARHEKLVKAEIDLASCQSKHEVLTRHGKEGVRQPHLNYLQKTVDKAKQEVERWEKVLEYAKQKLSPQ